MEHLKNTTLFFGVIGTDPSYTVGPMPSAILYHINVIFAEVIFTNLKQIAKFATF